MRRAAARRALSACAATGALGFLSHTLATRLRSLAGLVDGQLIQLGAQPAFAEAADGVPAAPNLRTRTLGVGNPAGTPGTGRVQPATSDDSGNHSGDGFDRTPNGRTGPDAGSDPTIAEDHVDTWLLVEKAQRGDGEAFGLLYDRYVEMVFKFVYFRINDRTLAEDFTSETFLRALRRISTITYQGRDIGAWFVTIARNIVLDHLKSARNRLDSSTGETVESKEQVPSTENAVLTNLQNEQLMAAVAQLGDEQRECVTLRFIHGLSVNETAMIMGKNDGAIKALQHRAVRKLADMVDRP